MALNSSENKICVVANRSKTYFYDKLIEKLGFSKADVVWIVTGQPWLKVLQEAGYPEDNLYYYEVKAIETIGDISWLKELEKTMPLPLAWLIGSDRFLSKRTNNPDQFLGRVGPLIEEFLNRHGVTHLFGEATWSVELLTYYIARRLRASYLIPHTIRIPSERFAFFTDPFQSEFERIESSVNGFEQRYDDLVDSMLSKGKIPRPNYWYINNKMPRVEIGYLGKFLRFFKEEMFQEARTEYMDYTLRERINNKLRMISNKRQISSLPFEKSFPKSETTKYALFTLHKQPEASIDVMGGFYTDQLLLIKAVAGVLPKDYTLLVKEHSNAIGDRGREFYNSIMAAGNVQLVDPWVNSHELMDQVEVVFTVSGTIGMEASLLGKKAIMFCPTFFTKLPNVHYVEDLKEIGEILRQAPTENRNDYFDFYKDLINNSYDGLIGDPVCFPEAMTDENLELVAGAFKSLLLGEVREKVSDERG